MKYRILIPLALAAALQLTAQDPSASQEAATRAAPSAASSATVLVVPVAPVPAVSSVAPPSSVVVPPLPVVAPPVPLGARPRATATAAPTGPKCKVVSSFDADGNKHFKQECQ